MIFLEIVHYYGNYNYNWALCVFVTLVSSRALTGLHSITYMHHGWIVNDSASNLNHKQANPTMHYSLLIIIKSNIKNNWAFYVFTLAAWASYLTLVRIVHYTTRTCITKHLEWWISHEKWIISKQIRLHIIVSW